MAELRRWQVTVNAHRVSKRRRRSDGESVEIGEHSYVVRAPDAQTARLRGLDYAYRDERVHPWRQIIRQGWHAASAKPYVEPDEL